MPDLGRLQPVSTAPGSDGLPRAELRLQACEEPQKRAAYSPAVASIPCACRERARFEFGRRNGGTLMKYMITWMERPQGSAIEYEKAQQRILDVFRRWEAPVNFKIELFVIR